MSARIGLLDQSACGSLKRFINNNLARRNVSSTPMSLE
jgi:hypothetical protein